MCERHQKIECEACGCEGELEFNGGIQDLSDTLPKRWRRRLIDQRAYILCDICGHPNQFLGGVSPYLKDTLELTENATCELPEKSDFYGPRVNSRRNIGLLR